MRRLKILAYWLMGRRNNVSAHEILNFLLRPVCTAKAKEKIERIENKPGYLAVYFRNFERPFYYPSAMSIDLLYQVTAEIFYEEYWHHYETDDVKVEEGDVVVDCGAAEGLFSFVNAYKCKKVYAIEPLGEYIDAMKMTFSNFNNVEVIRSALGSHDGSASITKNAISSNISSSSDGEKVGVTTLDKLFYEKGVRVSFIKADLEGSEMDMLKGAFKTIKSYTPKIAITTYHKSGDARAISEYLKDLDSRYEIYIKGIEAKHGSPVMLHAHVRK